MYFYVHNKRNRIHNMYCYWLVMRKRRDFVYILNRHLVWLTVPTTQKWLITWNFRGFSSNTHRSFMNFFFLKRLARADLIKHFQINLKNCVGACHPLVSAPVLDQIGWLLLYIMVPFISPVMKLDWKMVYCIDVVYRWLISVVFWVSEHFAFFWVQVSIIPFLIESVS